MRHQLLFLLAVLSSLGVLSCRNRHDLSWEEMTKACLPSSPLQKTDPKPPMSRVCHDFLATRIHFDSSFEELDPSGQEKEKILTVVYHLALYPAEWPDLNATLFGQVPIHQLFAEDLWKQHELFPEKSLNQVLFEYVFNALDVFRLDKDPSTGLKSAFAYYTARRHSITFVYSARASIDYLPILVHEARHSEYPHHEDCLGTGNKSCDEGTNKAVGWQLSYIYSLLRGNEQNLLTPQEVRSLSENLIKFKDRILRDGIPWPQFQVFFPKNQCNSLTDVLGPTYQQIVELEKLSQPEYFSNLTMACPLAKEVPSPICQEKLSEQLPFRSPEGVDVTQLKNSAQGSVHQLLAQPLQLGEEEKIFGMIPAAQFLPQELKAWAITHPTQPLNAFFVNDFLRSVDHFRVGFKAEMQGSVLLAPALYDSTDSSLWFDCLVDAAHPKTKWQCVAHLLKRARLSEIDSPTANQAPFCDEIGDYPSGRAAAFLWTALQGGKGKWSPEEESALNQVLCEQFQDLTLPLPSELLPLRTVDCSKL